jgi:hypothetical protein
LSFKAKVSSVTKLDNLKAAIISWTGTADVVTSDIVSAWGAEDTNPTLVANWTYENTPVDLNPTTSWATYSVSATIDTASTKNIAVFIWSDVTDTTLGDFLYITDVQLEYGSVATTFERRPYVSEWFLCRRYYRKDDRPRMNGIASSGSTIGRMGYALVPEMFAAPTVSYSAALPFFDGTILGTISTSIVTDYSTKNEIESDVNVASGTTATGRAVIVLKISSEANVIASAEL